MILKAYAIYDKQTGYMMPVFHQNDGQAIRAFAYDVNSPEMNLIKANSDDFQLEHIGAYCTDTGALSPAKPTVIVTGLSVKERSENV